MKTKTAALLSLLCLAACASKKAAPDTRPIDHGAQVTETAGPAATPPGGPTVPPPLNPEIIREIETLRAEGLQLLYSKDPSIKNPKLAFEKFLHAAQLGDPVSMDHVGGFYSTGIAGVEKSCPKSLEWYEKSAALGYPMALNNLAYTLVSCPEKKFRDADRAEELMKTLFANTPGLLAALDTYAAVLAHGGNFPQAAKTLEVVIDLADFTESNPEKIDEFKSTLKLYKQRKLLEEGFHSDLPVSPPRKKGKGKRGA
jgi:TPR repeat protein